MGKREARDLFISLVTHLRVFNKPCLTYFHILTSDKTCTKLVHIPCYYCYFRCLLMLGEQIVNDTARFRSKLPCTVYQECSERIAHCFFVNSEGSECQLLMGSPDKPRVQQYQTLQSASYPLECHSNRHLGVIGLQMAQ